MIDLDLAENIAFQNSKREVFKFMKAIPDVQKEETKALIENLIKLGITLMKEQVYVELMCEDD